MHIISLIFHTKHNDGDYRNLIIKGRDVHHMTHDSKGTTNTATTVHIIE